MKRGRITKDMVSSYEQYYFNLVAKYPSPRVSVVRLDTHHGFAMAVKEGLLRCTTTFSMVLQHDRFFHVEFAHLAKVCRVMLEQPHIRYVGFPTVTSKNHLRSLHCRYSLMPLVDPESHIEIIPNELTLHPLIFWYDSNHIAHVERYLQIYRPYHHLTAPLREALGLTAIKKMLLRRGDFIEDKFGQEVYLDLFIISCVIYCNIAATYLHINPFVNISFSLSLFISLCKQQRNQLTALKGQDELLLALFKWYGCYLLWSSAAPDRALVMHLRGRGFDPVQALAREAAREEGGGARTLLPLPATSRDCGDGPTLLPPRAPLPLSLSRRDREGEGAIGATEHDNNDEEEEEEEVGDDSCARMESGEEIKEENEVTVVPTAII
jgi:hypothetical protein